MSPLPAPLPLASHYLGRGLDAYRVSTWWTLAMLGPLGCMLLERGTSGGSRLLLAIGVAVGWQWLFARLRKRAFLPDGWLIAGAAVLLLGAEVPLSQWVLSLSLGIVFGEQVFGGRGRHLVNPVVVTLAFQQFLFPGSVPSVDFPGLHGSVLFAAVLLLLVGLVSWRVLLAAVLALSVTLVAGGSDVSLGFSAGLCFGLVFLAADPVAAAATPLGRWVYGLLLGLLAGVFGLSSSDPGSTSSLVSAALVAALFAPLIDRLAIAWHLRFGSAHVAR